MLPADELALSRIILAEPDNTGRWSDTDLMVLINEARGEVMLDLEWPESQLTANSVANQQEYALTPFTQILRVFLGGQQCEPTSIPILTGDQIEFYDSTAANFVSQWVAQAAMTYPVSTAGIGYPRSQVPWFPGSPPRYYLRGGNLGFVPAPANAVLIQVDIIPAAGKLVVGGTSPDILPDICNHAIAWKVREYAMSADMNGDDAKTAHDNYEIQLNKIRRWKKGMLPELPDRPIGAGMYRKLYSDTPPPVTSSTGVVD